MPVYFRVGPFSTRLGGGRKRSSAARKQAAARRQTAKWNADWKKKHYAPEAVAAREAERAEIKSRTRYGKITALTFDSLKGGTFTLTGTSDDAYNMVIPPELAIDFLSLKKGDIAEITITKDGTSIEKFWHLRRSNGSSPRNESGVRVNIQHTLPYQHQPVPDKEMPQPSAR